MTGYRNFLKEGKNKFKKNINNKVENEKKYTY